MKCNASVSKNKHLRKASGKLVRLSNLYVRKNLNTNFRSFTRVNQSTCPHQSLKTNKVYTQSIWICESRIHEFDYTMFITIAVHIYT